MRKFNGVELILHTTMWIIFTQWAPAYGDLHLLFVRESEYSVEFPCNCWFFLIQIIIFTSLSNIKRFQWLPFLWTRLICVLPAYWANDPHVTHAMKITQPLVHRFTGNKAHCRFKKCEKKFLEPFKKVEYTDFDQMLSDNLELLWIWAEFQIMNLGSSPVRIIRIFCYSYGKYSCFHSRHSFSRYKL